MWLLLNHKAPTWENLQKRNFVGPSRCTLCKRDNETNLHMFLHCPFTCSMWDDIRISLGTSVRWEGDSIEHALQSWIEMPSANSLKALPLISAWGMGIWLAKIHAAIFDDLEPFPPRCALTTIAILKSFPRCPACSKIPIS